MNIQELFNKAVSTVYNQGEQSMDQQGACLYRSPNGCVCAVGALITDEYYDKKLERKVVGSGYVTYAVEQSVGRELKPIEIILLGVLQEAHDNEGIEYESMGDFLENANEVAKEFNLQPWQPEKAA